MWDLIVSVPDLAYRFTFHLAGHCNSICADKACKFIAR